MKIYTRTGDDGKTSTFSGVRISKNSEIMNAQGSVDELNATIGLVIAMSENREINEILTGIQSELFIVGSEITLSEKGDSNKIRISNVKIKNLENEIDRLERELPKLTNFILPGGTVLASHLHLARTICRRAERDLVAFLESSKYQTLSLKYLNRLADLLFILARYANISEKREEEIWKI
jgi:cob(I)alamin adenosyltransferase